jgi:colanic acid/amylovoran biosynthesis glycosyltransferase
MRIAVVLDTFPELSETFLLHHITALLDGGHDVSIFAERPVTPTPVHQDVTRYDLLSRTTYLERQPLSRRQVVRVPRAVASGVGQRGTLRVMNPVRYGTGVMRLRALHALRAFSNRQFDLLHCHYAPIGWAYLSYRDVFQVPFVTSFHGEHGKSFGARASWHLRHLFAQGDAFIANSTYIRDAIRAIGAPAERLHIIPAPVNDVDTHFTARSLPVDGSRELQLLAVCRLDAAKGVSVAMRAVAALRAKGLGVHLQVIGDGPHRAHLERERAELNLTQAVTFAGWRTQDAVYAAYRATDVFVHPTLQEAQGVVLQEAMLHGLPVVASNTGGVGESLDHGAAGHLVPPNDADALAAAVERVLANPAATQAMAEHAVTYVRARYTKRAVLQAHERVYDAALSHGPRSPLRSAGRGD